MRHGYHMGLGFYGAYILVFILVVFSIFAFFLFRSKPSVSPFVIKLIDILKGKYASGIIDADEYIERKTIIEEARFSNPYTSVLLERYAHCIIDTKEFINIKNVIESNNLDDFTSESLAKGHLSYGEFKSKISKEI